MFEPFFINARSGARLSAVWREPRTRARRVWVVCPPFAEDEKSARRTLNEICEALLSRGDASLLFSYRGTGDSGGDFGTATLTAWREDIRAACYSARRHLNSAPICLLGVRLGASLALQVSPDLAVEELVLIEPVVNGHQYATLLGQRRRLRSMMTHGQAPDPGRRKEATSPDVEDMDGWPLGAPLRKELHALDLLNQPVQPNGVVSLLQVGPREQVSPQLEQLGKQFNCQPRAVVMRPFWTQLDYTPPEPLLKALKLRLPPAAVASREKPPSSQPIARSAEPEPGDGPDKEQSFTARVEAFACSTPFVERAVSFKNPSGRQLAGIWHPPHGVAPGAEPLTIVMLHGWSGYRTGPHQMLVRAARALAVRGHGVLRFDFSGRGDSDGDAMAATLATMAEDTRASLDWLRAEAGSSQIVLLGLCSGCEVAVASCTLPGVMGMALWSAPVFAAQPSAERTSRKRADYLKQYAGKLLRPATYRKLLTGQVDAKSVSQVVTKGGGGEAKNIESSAAGQLPVGWRASALERFAQYTSPLLLVYGSADPGAKEALEWHNHNYKGEPEVLMVEDANHSFYSLEWERAVIEATVLWVGNL